MPRLDRRSPEAEAYRKLYKTAKWQRIRAGHLAKHPLCARCRKQGRITVANTCDHVVPHKGDMVLFWDANNLQSLCPSCHSGDKQSIEKTGFSREVGVDGWPISADHPANKATR